jgi:hypothetical protein
VSPSSAAPAAARWWGPSVLALLAANALPMIGVLCFGWQIFPLVFLFWCENVIVGGFNVLKMLCARSDGSLGVLAKLFLIPFFCVHYGMFTFIHGVFVVGLFGGQFRSGMPFPDAAVFWRLLVEHHLVWAGLGLIISHAISFGTNYLGRGEFRRAALRDLMQQPYGRVVVLHVAILGGAFLMAALGSPVWGLLLLVALKVTLDLRAHLRERRKFAPPSAG